MKRKRRFPLVCTALVCLLFASCLDSKNPLSDPQKAEADARLPGVWRLEEGGNVTYYHVGGLGEGFPKGMLGALAVTHSQGGKLETDTGRALIFTTAGGKNHYLNVGAVDEKKWRASEEESPKELKWRAEIVEGYFICKYQVKGDTVELQPMNFEAKKQAIKSGVIKGTIDKDHAIITDTPENLLHFVTAHDKELFKDTMVLKRVK